MQQTRKFNYRASHHVEKGVANEHSYNLFLDVMGTMYRLRLWNKTLPGIALWSMWLRVALPIIKFKGIER